MKMPAFPEKLAGNLIPLLADDAGVQGGLTEIAGLSAMLIYGDAPLSRNDYLKALRYLDIAASADVPLVNCIDWSQAFQFSGLAEAIENACDRKIPLISLEGCPCIFADAVASSQGSSIALLHNELCRKSIAVLCALRHDRLHQRKEDGMQNIEICRPKASEACAIAASFKPFVLKHQILPRPENEIAASISDFIVAKMDGRIVGTVALRDFSNGLVEVRSLTVAHECEGRGLGSRLVSSVVELARERKASKVFTLTMRPNIFLRLGFFVVSLMRFPAKVQNDCLACPKKEQCDEVALLLELQ